MLEERTRLAEIIIKRGWELAEIRIPTDTWIAQFNAVSFRIALVHGSVRFQPSFLYIKYKSL